MNRITADFLWILNGCPLKTILFNTKRSGLTDTREPVATNSWRPTLKKKIEKIIWLKLEDK
jgi:hypothetical protein